MIVEIAIGITMVSSCLASCGLWVANRKLDRLASPATREVHPTPVEENRTLAPLSVGDRLTFENDGVPFFEIQRLDRPTSSEGSMPGSSRLLDFAQSVLGEAGRTTLARTGTYVLSLPPHIVESLRNGTMEWLPRLGGGFQATVRNVAGKDFTANAIFKSALGAVNPAAMALMAWQMLAVVTAQKFLADIDKKMNLLNQRLDQVLDWLQDQERGLLLGNYRYLMRVQSALRSGNSSAEELQIFAAQLEQIDRESMQIQASATLRLKRVGVDIRKHNQTPQTGEAAIQGAKTLIQRGQECVEVCLMTLMLRVLSLELRAAMPAALPLEGLIEQLRFDYGELGRHLKDTLAPLSESPNIKDWFKVQDKRKKYEVEIEDLKFQAYREHDRVREERNQQLSYLESSSLALKKGLDMEIYVEDNDQITVRAIREAA